MGLFKIVYAPLPALLLFVHLARWHSRREVVASLAWSAVGFVLSAAVAVAFFVRWAFGIGSLTPGLSRDPQ